MNPNLLSLLGGLQQPASQLFSNLATKTDSEGNPTDLAKKAQTAQNSKLGKLFGSNAASVGMGVLSNSIKDSGPVNANSNTARSVVAAAGDSFIPGLGQGLDLLGRATKNVTRNEDGTYKSDFASVVENINPVNLVGNVMSGDFSGSKMKARLAREKKARARRREVDSYMGNVQSKAVKLAEDNNDVFKQAYKKGGSLKKKDCGCNKAGDGIDTDVFKEFDEEGIKILQKFIGTVEDGVYKEVDKNKMKSNAKKNNKRLVDYLATAPEIRTRIIEITKMQKGGKTSIKDPCYKKVKARYKKWPCVPVASSEALTKKGWKGYYDLKVGDEILAYDMVSQTNKWTKVLNLHHFNKAPIIGMKKSKNMDFESTPDHNWVVYDKMVGRDDIIPQDLREKWDLIQKLRRKEITQTEANKIIPRIDWHYRWNKDVKTFEEFLKTKKSYRKGLRLMTTSEIMKANHKALHIVASAPIDEKVKSKYNFKCSLGKYGCNQALQVLKMSFEQARTWFNSAVGYDGNHCSKGSRLRKSFNAYGFKQKDPSHKNAFVYSTILSGLRIKYGNANKTGVTSLCVTERPYHALDTVLFENRGEKEVWCPETEYGTWVMRQNGAVTITGNSAYASASLAKCRKMGASNWGNKS